jgi:SAM-dependent methyltransferase
VPLPSKWWRWFFSRESRAWERRTRNPAYARQADEVVALFEGALSLDGPVLDIGCGPGAHMGRLSRPVVGADLAPGMLRVARASGQRALVQCDLGAGLPFRGDAFAGALGVLVLQHVPDARVSLDEVRRVVARNGTVLLVVPAKESGSRPRMGLYWRLRPLVTRVSGVITKFSVPELQTLVSTFDVRELYTERTAHVALLRNTKPR